jgi:hypothetical protein
MRAASTSSRHGRPERIEDLGRHNIVGFDESMAQHRMTTWLRAVAPGANIVARNNSVLGLLYSVRRAWASRHCPAAGQGRAGARSTLRPGARAHTHLALAHSARRSATRRASRRFFDFVLEEIDALRPILTG